MSTITSVNGVSSSSLPKNTKEVLPSSVLTNSNNKPLESSLSYDQAIRIRDLAIQQLTDGQIAGEKKMSRGEAEAKVDALW